MNKRQWKKRVKIINERVDFCNKNIIVYGGRKNGKTLMYKRLQEIIYNKSYSQFKKNQQCFLKGQLNLSIRS